MKRGTYERTPEIREKNRQATLANRNKGSTHPAWKGGRYKEPDKGYIMIYNPTHHRARKNGYVCEHILVMEEVVDRPVLRSEIVHHKNHVKDDNRPTNLMLTTPEWHQVHHHPFLNRKCSVEGCERKHTAKGYCKSHWKKFGQNSKRCSMVDCNKSHEARGYCRSHYKKLFCDGTGKLKRNCHDLI
jgi:hypothetical protein